MALSNFERMIQLAEEVFAGRTDPGQLAVNDKVIDRLQQIHPATLSEYDDGNGPVIWILLIPTTADLMNKFLSNEISEKELFELTPMHTQYDALYLCSAMTLEEYRGRGITKELTLKAIESIRKDHPIATLFVWPFTSQGALLAGKLAQSVGLPLKKKKAAY
jgi:ribosomal protein S18 acetylase RimI-like enzyme